VWKSDLGRPTPRDCVYSMAWSCQAIDATLSQPNSLVDFHTGIGAVDDENDDDYLIDHSIVLYLVGPDGKFLDFFTQATPADAIAAKIREHRSAS
jgi:cytochrome oxidase Cu insertion factor (SCO1/SenC/PrrC family)